MTKEPHTARRVLGVDLGLKRTGLAVSDPLGISTRPLKNLTPKSRAEDVAHLVALSQELEVETVVIGLPLHLQTGDDSMMARRARGFAQVLQEAFVDVESPVQVLLRDERLTSKRAAERLAASGIRKSKRKAALDSEAARVLVEAFLTEG